MISAKEVLDRLREGNQRFVSGAGQLEGHMAPRLRREFLDAQEPVAIILGCSDSRVPVEMVFDQDLGELFVIRVAGNVVAPSQIGSVEYAAECFGTPLVVVLGHTQCGAVQVTLDELRQPTGNQSRNLRSIVDRIRPSVDGLLEPDIGQAIRSNVRVSADNLSHGSAIIEQLVEDGKLLIVGAEYSLETGIVDFFYNVPPPEG
ncbi:MAG: carbonic anhydrase [Gammaproteobacteria bacterium]|nr:MAG: carbonic anhydrase [Gammaproteobacteria bacterium]